MSQFVLTALRLRQFRSYNEYAIELSPGVNIVVGPNASGKTNLLESILLITGSPSFRAQFTHVIEQHKEWARVDGESAGSKRTLKVEQINGVTKRTYELDGQTKHRLNFNDTVPVVVFEPEHMRLLTGSPELRRSFFDTILAELYPTYQKDLTAYKRTLAQRNRLLKTKPTSLEQQLFAWNVRLSQLAGLLVTRRLELIADINKQLAVIYSEIAQKNTDCTLEYQTALNTENYETSMLKKLEADIDKDILRGFTGAGPHREDFAVHIRGQQAEITASRGETRTLVLALKLLELQFIERVRGSKPLLLLDDVFSELDGSRRKSLTKYVENYQTIVTTTDADVVVKDFTKRANIIALG
jgi:DNA replication and repair protein RecF